MKITHTEYNEGKKEITIIAADENKSETFLTIPHKPGLPELIREGDEIHLHGKAAIRWTQAGDTGARAEFPISFIDHPDFVPGPLGL